MQMSRACRNSRCEPSSWRHFSALLQRVPKHIEKNTFPVGQNEYVSIASSDKEAFCKNKDAEMLLISSWKQNLFIS